MTKKKTKAVETVAVVAEESQAPAPEPEPAPEILYDRWFDTPIEASMSEALVTQEPVELESYVLIEDDRYDQLKKTLIALLDKWSSVSKADADDYPHFIDSPSTLVGARQSVRAECIVDLREALGKG